MTDPAPPRHHAWRPGVWEILLTAAVVAASIALLARADPAPGFQSPDGLTWVLTLGGTAVVVYVRRQPLFALVVTGIAFVLLTWRGDESTLAPFLVTGMLFAVGNQRSRRPAVIGLVFAAVGLLASAAARPPDLGPASIVQSLLIFSAAWVIGRLTRSRRQALLALVVAAEQQAAADRDQATLAQAEERLRIARELHDVLAHSISVISVQATVGEHLIDSDPSAGRHALQTIGAVSRSSMTELRQMLSLLRDDSAAGPSEVSTYQPARGLADLEPLVDTYRSAGLPVRTATAGEPRTLPAAADLCAYRIIQEALTNTLKHAGPSRALVALDYRSDELQVEIVDDGRGGSDTRTGHGVVGMRERAALLGGHFEAGSVPAGGFRVRATIPYGAAA